MVDIKQEVIEGLGGMHLTLSFIPTIGNPVVLPELRWRFGEAREFVLEDGLLYEANFEVQFLAQDGGELTVTGWGWARPQWDYSRHHFCISADSIDKPIRGGFDTPGIFRFLFVTPHGMLLPVAGKPKRLVPYYMPKTAAMVCQVDFPEAPIPDGTYRGFSAVIGWGERYAQKAVAAVEIPDHGARSGSFGCLVHVDPAAGAAAEVQDIADRATWLSTVYPPFEMYGRRKAPGASGSDAELFGNMVMVGLQQGGSNFTAEMQLEQTIDVEGYRQTWLNWKKLKAAGLDYFLPGQNGVTYYDHWKIHGQARPGYMRGFWDELDFLVPDDIEGGPNAEHRHQTTLFQLAGLTCNPVARDRALQYCARAAAACGLVHLDDGGYYAGGSFADYEREWWRMLSCVAYGYHIAKRWGMHELAAQFWNHLSRKFTMAYEDTDLGYRHRRGNTGASIPWGNTPLSHNPAGQLWAEDIAGTPLEGRSLRHCNTKAWWQTNQMSSIVLAALEMQSQDSFGARYVLSGVRDVIWQLTESLLGPEGDELNLLDPKKNRVCKYGSSEYLGLGRGWQTPGRVPPPGHNQEIELWELEAATLGLIFEGQGVDPVRCGALRRSLLVFNPQWEYEQWGASDVATWQRKVIELGGMPALEPLPPGVRFKDWFGGATT